MFKALCLVLLLATSATMATPSLSLFSVEKITPEEVTKDSAMCGLCKKGADAVVNGLLNYVAKAGVGGGCLAICSKAFPGPSLPNEICDGVCMIGGEAGLEVALENLKLNPEALCYDIKICKGSEPGATSARKIVKNPAGPGNPLSYKVVIVNTAAPELSLVKSSVGAGKFAYSPAANISAYGRGYNYGFEIDAASGGQINTTVLYADTSRSSPTPAYASIFAFAEDPNLPGYFGIQVNSNVHAATVTIFEGLFGSAVGKNTEAAFFVHIAPPANSSVVAPAAPAAPAPVVSAKPSGMCGLCEKGAEAVVNGLLNYVAKAGIGGGCLAACGKLFPSSNLENEICDGICMIGGEAGLETLLQTLKVDPDKICFDLKLCKKTAQQVSESSYDMYVR